MWTRLPSPDQRGEQVGHPVLQLTAIIFLLRPFEVWWLAPFALATAALSLAVPAVRRAPLTWLVLAALAFGRVVAVWPLADNHYYLLAYWCLAITLALGSPSAAGTLATSARWLVAATFAFAILWKGVLSPEYLDGRFFRVTLLTDARFADASMVFGGLTPEQMEHNRAFLEPLPDGAELLDPPPFIEPVRLRMFASVATWGGLVLETVIALLCAVPSSGRIAVARHAALLAFCVTTYALAPVAGFGWLIATLGLAQCERHQRVLRGAYIAVFVLILLYSEIPWTAVLVQWLGR